MNRHYKIYKSKHGRKTNKRTNVIKALTVSTVSAAMFASTVVPTTVSARAIDDKSETVSVALAARSDEQASRNVQRPLVAPTPASPLKSEVGPHDVKAVAKPTPKPAPPPPPAPAPAAKTAPAPKPAPAPAAHYTSASCQIGVVANAAAMCEAVYANFSVNSIGGYRAGGWGDHPTGHAIDIMVGAYNPLGDTIADWAIANAGNYNVKYVIWRQRTWMPGSGWGPIMADRGSISANHYDHVHVSFN
jgi:hypothetical protein